MTKLNELCNPINKLQAARRQIDCAIRIFLSGEDILAVHTLAYAALTVLIDYDKQTGSGCAWANSMREQPDEWSRKLANFLKHADRDPHDSVPSYPDFLSVYLLHMAGRIYAELHGGQPTEEIRTLAFYVAMSYRADRDAEKARDTWEYTDDDELQELHLEEIRQRRAQDEATKAVVLARLNETRVRHQKHPNAPNSLQ